MNNNIVDKQVGTETENIKDLEIECDKTFIKLKTLLDDRHISYQLMEHEPAKTSEEAALIRNTSLESGAKAILIKADKKHYLIVFSASLKFSSKKLKKILNAKSLRFADLNEVKEITGCLNGAVPPFGSLFNLHTIVDESLFKQGEYISFNAGMRTRSMIMDVNDYKTIENPQIVNICEE